MGALDRVRAEFGSQRSEACKTCKSPPYAGFAGSSPGQLAKLALSLRLESRINALARQWNLTEETRTALVTEAACDPSKWISALLLAEDVARPAARGAYDALAAVSIN
jgi:hypothetical protein